MARKKILSFFSEQHLFSDTIEKIGGRGAPQFRKARMKAWNEPYTVAIQLYIYKVVSY